MRVVTVARKPCVASSTTANVVAHEAGALDLKRSRVGVEGHAGRWPSNVVLVHRPGCRVVGMRKVATGTAHRKKSGGRTIFSETEKPPMENMSYAGADGKETVPDWRCVPECPVRRVDGDTEGASRFFKGFGGGGSEA